VSVFDRLVGQPLVSRTLELAVAGAQDALAGGPGLGMTQTWLFTGPPGSGRTTAARAFAAALQCPEGGCGRCHACTTAFKGNHADVTVVSTQQLSIGVDETRDLVLEAAALPSNGRWRVLIVEDADRLTDEANNALLKALEEPTPRTVWMLSAPTAEDMLPTIRSRCRIAPLVTPPTAAVARHLVDHEGVDPAMAAFAARASQGHIGRAKGLAADEETRLQRAAVLQTPSRLRSLQAVLAAAADLVDDAKQRAEAATKDVDAREREELARLVGAPSAKSPPRWAAAQFKALKKQQETRAKRSLRDHLDRSLLDLMSYYRDVVVVQLGADVDLVNAELAPQIEDLARAATPETTIARLDAIATTRERIGANANVLLAVEDLMISLKTD
jgi:DNA polymerase-3 subunit delta'